jgi:hypothetical protein
MCAPYEALAGALERRLRDEDAARPQASVARYYNCACWSLRRILLNQGVSKLERLGTSPDSLRWAHFIIDTNG